MLTQEHGVALSNIADLNQLKADLKRLPLDVGDYVAELLWRSLLEKQLSV